MLSMLEGILCLLQAAGMPDQPLCTGCTWGSSRGRGSVWVEISAWKPILVPFQPSASRAGRESFPQP